MTTIIDCPRSAAGSRGSNARGIAAMLLSMAFFVTSDTLIKLIGRDMPIGQIMFIRGLFATLLVAVMAASTGVLAKLPVALTPMVAVRAFVEVGATVFFFTGLMRLPFADAAAIGQFTPLAVTAGAALFLNEPVGWRRWLATAVGLIGVMLIIRPGTTAFNWAALLIVVCVFFVAARDLITRMMGDGIPILLLILVSAIAVTLTGLSARLFESWIEPSSAMIGNMALSALGVTGGYYTAIVAMRAGEISVVAPFRYSAILIAVLWAYLIFDEVPDPVTWLGIAILVGAGFYTFHREHVLKRQPPSPATIR